MTFDTTICNTPIEVSPSILYSVTADNPLTGLTLSTIGPVNNSAQLRFTATDDPNLFFIATVSSFTATDDTDLTFDVRVGRISTTGTSNEWYVSPESNLLNPTVVPAVATATGSSSMSINNNPALVFHQNLVMAKSARFEVEDYFVVDGYPIALDGYGVKLTVSASIGSNSTVQSRKQFDDFDMESDSRWVAIPDTYQNGVDWFPYSGVNKFPLVGDPVNPPVLISDFSRQFNDFVFEDYAMEFSDGKHFSINTPFNQNYYTLLMACVLNEPTDEWYGIASSGNQDGANTDESPNISLRYHSDGTFALHFIDEVIVVRLTKPEVVSLKPVIVGFSIDIAAKKATLLAVDYSGMQYAETVTLPDFLTANSDLFIGASPSRNSSYTADMDVLEINQYVRELSIQEILNYMSKMSQIYGVLS